MNYEEFLNIYSTDFLSDIDVHIHDHMLNKFFEITQKKEKFVFFDVGCNAGSFIKVVKLKNINAKIHAFEPHPYLFKYLTEKYTDDTINQKCVSDNDDNITIYIPSLSVAISSIINRPCFQNLLDSGQQISEFESECTTIDTYTKDEGIDQIDFIKIDVEGAEYFVFNGARNLLKENRITCGQFEIGNDESGYTFDDIKSLLNEYGYVVEHIFPNDCFFYLGKQI